jgi:hypothetical protein
VKIKKNYYLAIVTICFYLLFFSFLTLYAKQVQSPQDSTNIAFIKSNQTLGDVLVWGMAIADVDLDEDNDIFIPNYIDGGVRCLWINDGNGNFTLTSQLFGSGASAAHDVDMADLNGDIYPDIFLANHNGPNDVYFNNGNGSFNISGQSIGNIGEHPQTIQLEDIDNDGDKDAYIYNSSAPNRIWLNDGNGFFTMRNIDYGGNDSNNQFLADFNNDSFPDLFVSMRTGPAQIWMNDGAGNITNTGHTLGGGGESIDCDDVDCDGDTDIVVAGGNEITVWLNQNNTGTFAPGFSFGEGATECKLFDTDLDGDFDLVTGDFFNGNKIWINDGTGSFSSVGTIFGNLITYSLDCGKLDADDDYDVIMGFEPGSGGIAIYFNESTIVNVDEKETGSVNYKLHYNYPNPFNPKTTIEYYIPSYTNIKLKIYNSLGREVKTLVNEYQTPGRKSIVWNGTNNLKCSVASGVYYYRIQIENQNLCGKLIYQK